MTDTTEVNLYELEIENFAKIMANVYEANSNPELSGITEEGLELVKNEFGNVPVGMRAAVFIQFMKQLEERGVAFDPELAKE